MRMELDEPADGSSPAVVADPIRLKQVMLNLLSNAVKYNRDSGQIFIKAELVERDDAVVLSVQDSGRGLTEEELATVFEPFVRHRAATTVEGTGIGLTITGQLVELMNGQIGVHSEMDVGTRFFLTLPVAHLTERADGTGSARQAAAVADAGRVRPGPSESDLDWAPRPMVLYIEDNPANIKLVTRLLAQAWPDVELISVHTAELGLMLLHRQRPLVLLMDINLPGMNGFEALAEVRASPTTRTIPVVAVSANATDVAAC